MLCVVTEVTERVIGERRLRVLRDLAAQSSGIESVEESCRRAMQVLAQYPIDLPFAALYLLDEQSARCTPRGVCSRELPEIWFPTVLATLVPVVNPWHVATSHNCATHRH